VETPFFLLFAAMAIVAALGVVLAKNPVYSALSLIACFVQIAAIFVLLRSPFLAVVQIFVYVGTTIVLFIIVIVMLDIRQSKFDRFIPGSGFLALFLASLLGGIMLAMLLASDRLAELSLSRQSAQPAPEGTVRELGNALFTQFLLPFEVVSVILLVALIGAILLAKKESK
jgi:NADH-quinone oxidoreductase subunit J